jgi:hypothetical protein
LGTDSASPPTLGSARFITAPALERVDRATALAPPVRVTRTGRSARRASS